MLDEVPEMGATSVVREEGRYAGVVCRGDIALGKIPTVKLEAKRKHYRGKANETSTPLTPDHPSETL